MKHIIRILPLFLMAMAGNLHAQDLSQWGQAHSALHGSITSTGNYYNALGTDPRRDPFSGVITGNFTLTLKGFSMPFSFSYSNQNKTFRHPFNQLGLSPRYKWATLHLGYRNIRFSRFVLGGHTVLGAGLELRPGKFRFGFVYGRLKRATNTAVNIFKPVNDTLMEFDRKMMSMKIGFGTERSFLDLILLRAYDDTLKFTGEYARKDVFPAANIVAGLHTRLQLGKRWRMEAEVAASVYTDNQKALIQVNDVPEWTRRWIPVNASTSFKTAAEGKIDYQNGKGFSVGLHYRRIEPDYRSMGTYFITNDVENITLKTGFRALKNKMQVSGSIGLERNNLQTVRNATTRKTVGSVQLHYQPAAHFGLTATYANYSINQQAGRVQIADSVKLYQTNGTMMISPHLSFMSKNKKVQHFISGVLTRMQLTDHNPQSVYSTGFTTLNGMLSYNLSVVPSGWRFMLSINRNHVKMQAGNSDNRGATVGINKGFKKQKINLGMQLTYLQSMSVNGTRQILTPVLQGRMQLGKHHSISMKINMIMNNDTAWQSLSTEQFGMMRYVFQF